MEPNALRRGDRCYAKRSRPHFHRLIKLVLAGPNAVQASPTTARKSLKSVLGSARTKSSDQKNRVIGRSLAVLDNSGRRLLAGHPYKRIPMAYYLRGEPWAFRGVYG
jgi:hypothetical protein